jgi:hypothetical protein
MIPCKVENCCSGPKALAAAGLEEADILEERTLLPLPHHVSAIVLTRSSFPNLHFLKTFLREAINVCLRVL